MGYKQAETDKISEEKLLWLYTVVRGLQLKKFLFLAIIRASTKYAVSKKIYFHKEYLNTLNSVI